MAGFQTDAGRPKLAEIAQAAANGPRLEFDFGPHGITMLTQGMDNFGIAMSMVRVAHDVHMRDYTALCANLDKLFGALGVWMTEDELRTFLACLQVYVETAPLAGPARK